MHTAFIYRTTTLPYTYIRRTTTTTSADGRTYSVYRLLRSVRKGQKVRQQTLLHLGRHFEIEKPQWRPLCRRIVQRLRGEYALLPGLPETVEKEAQRIAAQLMASFSEPIVEIAKGRRPDWRTVDSNAMEHARPRRIGVSHVGLWALEQLGFDTLLQNLGVGRSLRQAAIGSVIGRMAKPGSERATYAWLAERSALGELLGARFENMSVMQLYRASDALMHHREAIERHLFRHAVNLFAVEATVTFYDLTNTYFEGAADKQKKAQRGHSKEKRSDRPLLTLAVVLDGCGFVRRSAVFAGNVREEKTLQTMMKRLNAPPGARLVMDRGVAGEKQIAWLRDNGYRYLVVSRNRKRAFDLDASTTIKTASGHNVRLCKVVSEDGKEVRLYSWSQDREKKEKAIMDRFATRFETALTKLSEGLSRPCTHKRLGRIHERIGRLKAQCRGIGKYYEIDVVPDAKKEMAVAVRWKRKHKEGSMMALPGVHCLPSNEVDWDVETLWRTYSRLTDLEAVFRSLMSELGLRPIHHSKAERADGHLFITVIAYQAVQVIRRTLTEHGITASWTTLRQALDGQMRTTTTFPQRDGRILHVRKTTTPEGLERSIYAALGVAMKACGLRRTMI